MPKIFISYRRADSQAETDSIYHHLAEQFGANDIFIDHQNIPAGTNWKQVLRDELDNADVLLVVIGSQWLEEFSKRSREDDYVFFEVEQALRRGTNVTIIPVLLNNTKMPSKQELPPEIKQLSDIQGIRVRSGGDFERDIEKLIIEIEVTIKTDKPSKEKQDSNWKFWVAAVFIPIIVGLMTLIPFFYDLAIGSEPTPTFTSEPTNTSQVTLTDTVVPTLTPTGEASNTPQPTLTETTLPTVNITSYPCDGEVLFGTGGLLNQVRVQPSGSSPARPPVERGSSVIINQEVTDFGVTWYLIEYGDNSGWIPDEYIEPSEHCPT